jgi:HD-GYP domain-containing protein (c-di-GMP phosphodiesterase class II)
LIAAGLTTLWLFYYVRFYLPSRVESRMIESMHAFSRAVELRFPNSAGKSDEVFQLASLIAKRFGYTKSELHELELAAFLRDIGCCSIPYRPFNDKPRSEWSEAEWRVYSRHPEVSGAMLELVPSLRHLANSVRWHHTPFNGQGALGVPSGPEIPINARILHVASDYVWISHDIGTNTAMESIIHGSGTTYCPEVVAEFQQVLTSFRVQEPEPSFAGS